MVLFVYTVCNLKRKLILHLALSGVQRLINVTFEQYVISVHNGKCLWQSFGAFLWLMQVRAAITHGHDSMGKNHFLWCSMLEMFYYL